MQYFILYLQKKDSMVSKTEKTQKRAKAPTPPGRDGQVRMMFWVSLEHRQALRDAAKAESAEKGYPVPMIDLVAGFLESLRVKQNS